MHETHYRPRTKFREGNVFTGDCLFTAGAGEGYVTSNASCYRSHSRVPPFPLPGHQAWGLAPHYPPATDIWWSSPEIIM